MKTIAIFFLLIIFPGIEMHAQDERLPDGRQKPDSALSPSATLIVTKTADTNDGVCNSDCSLREAVAAAASGDTITFASPLFDTAQSIDINGQINLNKNLTIVGRGPSLTTIRNVAPQGTTSRVLVNVGNIVNLSGLTITGGNSIPTDFTNGCGTICGGGIYNSGTMTITNSVIAGNTATAANGGTAYGGGIFNFGTLILTNCTVRGNTVSGMNSDNFGGGVYQLTGSLTLVGTTVSGNSVAAGFINYGGGIAVQGGTTRIVNSTVSGNSVSGGTGNQGAGIFMSSTVVNVSNSTISGNTAGNGFVSRGGGMYILNGSINVRNSIISGNSASTSGPDIQGTITTNDSNIIGNQASVRLAPLGNYGGPTQTHALLDGSSAINAGNNCVLTANGCGDNNEALVTDQRGRNRVGQVDIGAFELVSFTVTKTADSNDGLCNSDCSLREAVAAAQSSDVIQFASPLFDTAQTVQVNGQIVIDKSLTIIGRGADLTTVQNIAAASATSRVFLINSGTTVNISGLTITGGNLTAGAATNGCGATLACGGGVHNSGDLTITNSVISGNIANGSTFTIGGGIYSIDGALTIIGSTISGNRATCNSAGIVFGGGIFLQNNTLNVINSTVSGNVLTNATNSQGGGGIRGNLGTVNLINSTITNNSANNLGGGVLKGDATLNMVNTIISGNFGSNNPDLDGSPSASSTNNLIGGNAGLLPLGNYGGTTPTHALLTTSGAVNAGNNCVVTLNCSAANPPSALTTDQRGRGRDAQVDIGAFELVSLSVTKTADTNDGVCDSDCSLREAVAAAASGDTIVFASPTFDTAQTVQVNGQVTINKSLFINGRGASLTTIQNIAAASATSRVILTTSGTTVNLSGLTITGGNLTAGGGGFPCTVSCGGGIANQGSLTITNSAVSGNAAAGTSGGAGGGIINSGTLNLTNSTLANNTAGGSSFNNGGGIHNLSGTMNVTNSTLSGNSVSGINPKEGGGIYNGNATLNITNSTLSGNFASGGNFNYGGGIRNTGTLNITNSTLSGNFASGGINLNQGGGIYSTGTVNARNTIISGNSATTDPNFGGSFAVNDANIIDNEANVKLAPLGFYGGATMTMPLLSGSALAIDTGNSCVTNQSCANFNAPVALTSDQRGASRVGNVDIGAFEANSSANGGTFRGRLPDGTINTSYNFTLVPSNGSTTYAVTGGALPPGMNLTTAFAPNAVVSVTGTPTSGGIFNFTVTATNGGNTSVTDFRLDIVNPTAAGVSVSGRVMTSEGSGLRNATVILTDASGASRNVRTSSFGYFRFEDVDAGQTYVVTVNSKRFTFAPQVVYVGDEVTGLDFTASGRE